MPPTAPEDEPGQAGGQTQGDRAGGLHPRADQGERGDGADREVGDRDGQQCRGCGSEAADGEGADDLEAPGLLLGPRVADDEQNAHDRGGDEQIERQLVRHHRPEGVVVEAKGRTGHHDGGRVGHQRRAGLQGLGRRVRRVERSDRPCDENPEGQGPHRDPDALEPEKEPQQLHGAGPGLRRPPGTGPAGGSQGLGSRRGPSGSGRRGVHGGAHRAAASSETAISSP